MEPREQELDSLIKKVATEVINKIMMQPGHMEKIIDTSKPCEKKMLLLIPAYVMNLHEFIKHAQNRYSEYDLTVGTFSKVEESSLQQVKLVLNLDEEVSIEKLSRVINDFDTVCFLSPGLKQMEAIAEGNDSGFCEGLMIYFLLHKKKTIILVDYDVQHLPSNNFTKKVKSLLVSISDMGICIDILGQEEEKKVEILGKANKLITEKDVEDICRSGIKEIRCEKGCIITPLAKDRAKEIGINIIQQF